MEIKANKRKGKYWTIGEERINKILADIAEGSPNKIAAEASGVSERHFYSIVAQGIVDIENEIFDSQAAKLTQSLRKIDMEEIKWCRNSIKASEKSHRGAEWTLEKAYWRYFGNSAETKELAEEIQKLKQELKGVKNNGEVDDSEEEENS